MSNQYSGGSGKGGKRKKIRAEKAEKVIWPVLPTRFSQDRAKGKGGFQAGGLRLSLTMKAVLQHPDFILFLHVVCKGDKLLQGMKTKM